MGISPSMWMRTAVAVVALACCVLHAGAAQHEVTMLTAESNAPAEMSPAEAPAKKVSPATKKVDGARHAKQINKGIKDVTGSKLPKYEPPTYADVKAKAAAEEGEKSGEIPLTNLMAGVKDLQSAMTELKVELPKQKKRKDMTPEEKAERDVEKDDKPKERLPEEVSAANNQPVINMKEVYANIDKAMGSLKKEIGLPAGESVEGYDALATKVDMKEERKKQDVKTANEAAKGSAAPMPTAAGSGESPEEAMAKAAAGSGESPMEAMSKAFSPAMEPENMANEEGNLSALMQMKGKLPMKTINAKSDSTAAAVEAKQAKSAAAEAKESLMAKQPTAL